MKKDETFYSQILKILSDHATHTHGDIVDSLNNSFGFDTNTSRKVSNSIYQLRQKYPNIKMPRKGVYIMETVDLLPSPPSIKTNSYFEEYVNQLSSICQTMSETLEKPFEKWNTDEDILVAHKFYHNNQKILSLINEMKNLYLTK